MTDPVHTSTCSPTTTWTTINASEALPGVVTPLTWSFYGDPVERAMRQAFGDLGALARRETGVPDRVEDRMWAAFYGRPAANLNRFREMADRMPGTSGDSIEEQIFGQVRDGVRNEPTLRRWPAVMAKMPVAFAGLGRTLRRARAEQDVWWRRTISTPLSDVDRARDQFRDAAERFETVMRPHLLGSIVCQAIYEQVTALARTAGEPGLERSLVTGYGSLDETRFVAGLWQVSRDTTSLEHFLAEYGYQGTGTGELANPSWREDPKPVRDLVERYRGMADADDPARVEQRQAQLRRESERRLRAGLGRTRRPAAGPVLRLAAAYLPLRGTGKVATAQCIDLARRAARTIGQELTRSGQLTTPDDVFFLRAAELLAPPTDAAELVATRRARHREFAALELPDLWQGVPEPGRGPQPDGVRGIGVSPGVAEGTVRVILDPADAEHIEHGDVIACVSTDPSWASLFLLAAAIVIDVGGPLSHGAIVARELGIPCVINTRSGTKVLRSGTRVRVDGSAGTVDHLEGET